MANIADLMAACDALESSGPDPGQRQRHAMHLREGLTQLAEEIRDLRAQRESLEGQVMAFASEEQSAAPNWENVIFLLEDDDFDSDPAA